MTRPKARVHAQTDENRTVDLWSFALRCYSIEQAALLDLQGSARLHINDALFAAYARSRGLVPDAARWQQVRTGRPRQVLLRVRRLRYRLSRSDPNRKRALEWELALERWDLARLAGCFVGRDGQGSDDAGEAQLLSQQCDLSVDAVNGLLDRLVHTRYPTRTTATSADSNSET